MIRSRVGLSFLLLLSLGCFAEETEHSSSEPVEAQAKRESRKKTLPPTSKKTSDGKTEAQGLESSEEKIKEVVKEPWSDRDIANVYALFCDIRDTGKSKRDEVEQEYVDNSRATKFAIQKLLEGKTFTVQDLRDLVKERIAFFEARLKEELTAVEKNAAAKNLEGLKEIAVRISPKKFNAKKNLLSGSREDRMVTLAYDRKQVDLSDFKLPDLHLAELRMAYKSAVATQGGPLLGALKTQRNVSVGIAEFKNVKDYFLACEDSRESRGISFFSNRWDDHGWGYDYRKAWSYADENADLINQDMRERAIKWASERVAKDLNVPDDPRAKALGYPEEMWIPDYNLMKLVPSLDKARGRFPNLEEIEVEESGKVQGVFGLAWQPADWNPKIRNYSIVIQNPLSEYIREYPVFRKIEWDKDLNPHESYNFDR